MRGSDSLSKISTFILVVVCPSDVTSESHLWDQVISENVKLHDEMPTGALPSICCIPD